MAGFWDANDITPANMNKLGPIIDGVVGTNGEYQDIYAAMLDPGGPQWTKVFITDGAIMSQACAFTAGDEWLIGVGYAMRITGDYALSFAGAGAIIIGIGRSTITSPGILITGDRAHIERCVFLNCTSHGLHLNSANGNHHLHHIVSYGNGGDGIRFEQSGDDAMLTNIRSQTNTGYGINNVNNARICAASGLLNGNTAGSWNGASTYRSSSVYAP